MVVKGQGVEFWRPHIEAMIAQGQMCRQYGEQHGLSRDSLQWWRRKLNGPVRQRSVVAKPLRGGPFVALRVGAPKSVAASRSPVLGEVSMTRLNLGGGASLEFTGVPSAPWLAQFARSLREAG